jgi:hypothetical protein
MVFKRKRKKIKLKWSVLDKIKELKKELGLLKMENMK